MSKTNLPVNEKFLINKQDSSGEKLHKERENSLENPQAYWAEKAEAIDWFKKWDKILDDSNKPFYKWFAGGILNISHNALDRHITTHRKNKLAYIFKNYGLKKGDRVAVYLPVVPELPITLLATARIGGIHTVVFSGFSAEALADRINDCGAKILVTADGSFRRGKMKK